jgi:linoleoyl-CoA desaturase
LVSNKLKFKSLVDNIFYQTLHQRVQVYFSKQTFSKKANGWMISKLVFCFFFFFSLYALILLGSFSVPATFFLTLLFGFASALLVFNVGHDALHGALFNSKKVNTILGYSFELVGMSSYAWYLKHNVIHHIYPNVIQVDFDIDAYPILRLSPADKLLYHHRYQHVYAPLAYMLFSLLLVFFNDFRILYNRQKLIDGKRHPLSAWVIVVAAKLLYSIFMLVLPMLLLNIVWWQVLVGFVALHGVLSLGICLVLIPSHLFEQTVYISKNGNGKATSHWAEHQLESTLDYSSESRIANFLFGGLNTNAAHHLFPKICHIHLIPVTKIVKQTAKEFGVAYNETSLIGAIISHFRILKLLGQQTSLNLIKPK